MGTKIVSDFSTTEQQHILGAFNKMKVKYIGFDSYAANSYSPTLPYSDISVWVKSTLENFEAIKKAISLGLDSSNRVLFKKNVADFQNFDDPNRSFISIGFTKNRMVKVFLSIPDFQKDDFDKAFSNAELRKAGVVNTKILSVEDTYKSLKASQNRHKEKFLINLEREHGKILNVKKSSKKVFPKKDFNYILENVDLEAVLEKIGYEPQVKKWGKTQHLWSRKSNDSKIVVFMNNALKGYFDLNDTENKGTLLNLLLYEYDRYWPDVFATIDEVLINPNLANINSDYAKGKYQGSEFEKLIPLDLEQQTKLREKAIREENQIYAYTRPSYLKECGLTENIIYAPEFLGQINNIPYESKETQGMTFYNTAFPMRNEFGLISFIVQFVSNSNKHSGKIYFAEPKFDGVWLSNELLKADKNINATLNGQAITIAAGTLGALHKVEKDNITKFQFSYNHQYLSEDLLQKFILQPTTIIRALVDNDIDFSKAKAQRMIITESPIDALSFAQLIPMPSEYNLYISTGGSPSSQQIEFINKLLQKHTSEVILAMNNTNLGLGFNTTLAGALQHPFLKTEKDLKFRIDNVNNNQNTEETNAFKKPESHLKVVFPKSKELTNEKIESLVDKIIKNVGAFLDKDVVKVIERVSNQENESFKIAIPNSRRHLTKALDILLKIRSEIAGEGKEYFLVKKPITKNWNEDLQTKKKHPSKI
jgi:hypothetical protein